MVVSAVRTVTARSARVLDLYRRTLREVPRTINVFDLSFTEAEMRSKVRGLFSRYKNVQDGAVIDRLVYKGELDLEETVHVWKQRTHLMRLLDGDDDAQVVVQQHKGESSFLRGFYEGVQ